MTITTKKRFRVRAEITSVFYICVEAENAEEAYDIGTKVGERYYEEDYLHDWEILDVLEEDDIGDDELLSASLYNSR